MPQFRAFLSMVSSEFGRARDALAKDLSARGATVKWQEAFRQEPQSPTLLGLLHDYVRTCQAVICALGSRSGACPPPAAITDEFKQMLPQGIERASYTQWEFFFARHYGRRISRYRARPDYQPDRAAGEDVAGLQQAFLQYINEQGLHWTGFGSVDELRAEVLKEDWPAERPDKPVTLPYLSLGTLFKGRSAFLHQVHASLDRQGTGAAARATAVHGMGGVGKTRAAVEYAWAYSADYTVLLFVQADSNDNLRRGLAMLTAPLRLPEQAATDDPVRVNAALAWLRANPDWLLILDNVDTEAALAAVTALLGQLISGQVLLTSRLDQFPRGIEKLEQIPFASERERVKMLVKTKS
jgi:hypothetical protein